MDGVLGLPLSDPALWEQALTHRSFAFEQGLTETNERLEFLGDAVLGIVITDLAFRQFPDLSEGELAKLRAATVKMSTLGRGEEMSGGRDKPSILADGMEAILGAVYLDRGLDATRTVIERLFWSRMEAYSRGGGDRDHKMSLQEVASRDFGVAPEYRVSSQGPDHAKEFTATVFLRGAHYGSGRGRSKKEAEQQAAREALEAIVDPADRAEADD